MERIIKLRELEKKRQEKDEIVYELMEGLRYTDKLPLRPLVDDECRHPSRVLLTKLMIEMGADPNVQSPEVLHTPLHWLSYWGDHRAIKQLLEANRLDLVFPKGCCVNKDKYIQRFGAFNAFQTNNGQTPVDIAGDLNNYQSLKV